MRFWHFLMITSILWCLSEVLLAIIKRSHADSTEGRDRSSLRFLWLAIIPSIVAGIYLGVRGIGYVASGALTLPYIGLALILFGLLIRWSAILTLRRYFTVDVAIAKDHKIVDRGLYKYIRHPAYSGALMSFLGLGLTFSNWLSFLIITIPVTGAFLYRIRVEENALHLTFGDEYAAYCRRTKRLIPGIY